MGGKRQANVLSALIQNFDTVEEAIEASANSSGSAIKENERYLDSIQGKIDQFNNAVQAMWNDTLNSDVVKFFVDLGTKLVKLVDAVGPLNIALVGLFTYLGKQHGLFSGLFKPAEESLESLQRKLVKAQDDLNSATQKFEQTGSAEDLAEKKAQEQRVNDISKKIQERTAPADPELDALIGDRDTLSQEVDALKAKREELQKAVESDSPDDMLKLVEIDTTSIDEDIEKTQEKLIEAKQKLVNAESESPTVQINGGIRMNRDRDQHIADASQEIADIEKELDALQQKKVDVVHYAAQFDLAEMDDVINDASNKLDGMTDAINAKTAAQNASNAATGAGVVVDQAATVAEMASASATWADFFAVLAHKDATLADVAASWNKVVVTKLLNTTLGQYIVQLAGVTAAEAANMTMGQLLGAGLRGLGNAFLSAASKAITFIVSLGPIAWAVMAITAAITIALVTFSAMHKTTKELQEELDGFKSKLSDVENELSSVNNELETTSKRMEELLAKDKLTFEEQEELDRLRKTNDELERRKDLLEEEEEYKSGRVGRQAARVVESARAKQKGANNQSLSSALGSGTQLGEQVYQNIDDYASIKEKMDNATSLKDREKYQKKLDKEAEKIDEYLETLSTALDGVEYGDSEESDAALDYLAELESKYAIARGSDSAKTNAIKDTLEKPEFEQMSKAIDYYVEALKDGDTSAADSIAGIINGNEEFVEDLKARGVEAQDVIDLYTKLGDDMRFDTLEGKAEELKRVTGQLSDALANIGQFMNENEVDTAAIAEYFKGTSSETRDEIAKLVQQINDGETSVENALKQFELFGVQSVLKIEITEVQTNFQDVFTDLENADGLVDTFNELAEAIGSTSNALDALNAAQAEMDAKGRVSIETALKLMEYTDDYSKVLTISEGKLILNENAEENLIEARIESMKASALKALEDSKAARETIVLAKSNAEAALSTYNSAVETEMAAAVTASAWDKVLAAAAGLFAGIKAIFTEESWTEAYDRAYQEVISSRGESRVAEVEAKYASEEEKARKAQLEKDIEAANKALEEQDDEIDKLQGNYDLISGLNKDNIGDVFGSDDFDNPDDVKDDTFQKEMDYWENRIAANQAKYEQLQNEIDLLETKGQKADASFYEEQIELENERKWLLEQQKAEALARLQAIEDAGNEGSESWWEVANVLNDIEGELDDVTASIIDLQDAIGEIDTYKFEEFNNRLGNLTSKLETIRNLIAPDGEEDWFDDNGDWTESGVAVLGSYLQELETYKQGYEETIDELDKYAASYEGNEAYYEAFGIHSEQEWYDKTEELISQQYDFAESISDTEKSVVDMYNSNIDAVEKYTETLIDSYNDYIDSVKEALEAERDYTLFSQSYSPLYIEMCITHSFELLENP